MRGLSRSSSCASRGAALLRRRARRPTARFEDTDRYVRGRIVAALVEGATPAGDWAAERHERAVQGLIRDGLIASDDAGLRLP